MVVAEQFTGAGVGFPGVFQPPFHPPHPPDGGVSVLSSSMYPRVCMRYFPDLGVSDELRVESCSDERARSPLRSLMDGLFVLFVLFWLFVLVLLVLSGL